MSTFSYSRSDKKKEVASKGKHHGALLTERPVRDAEDDVSKIESKNQESKKEKKEAFSEKDVRIHLNNGITKDLASAYHVSNFLEDDNVSALTIYEYAHLTNQS